MSERFFEDAPQATPTRTKQRRDPNVAVSDEEIAQALGIPKRTVVEFERRLDSEYTPETEALRARWDACLAEILRSR